MSAPRKYALRQGDCLESLTILPDNSVDAIITDPPYEYGFMGKSWDATGIANNVDLWRALLRVIKPGGHVLSFGGTRTSHRMVCAMEDAGWEIRDSIQWVYGVGFPKSLNVSKAIDEAAGAVREIIGVGTNGMGRLNQNNAAAGYRPNPYSDGVDGVPITAPATDEAKQWDGWGTALKPGHEPICLARKPFVGTVAGNVLVHGTGALNIDGCRIAGSSTVRSNHAEMGYHGGNLAEDYVTGSTKGRWPANLLLDEDAAAELDRQADGVSRFFYCTKASRSERDRGLDTLPVLSGGELTDRVEGTAGLKSPRAGAGRTSGGRNTHPTVKPLALMRYLCRLVTPPEGVVLDPFMGSGTTGMAALLEGFRFLGIERESEYLTLAHARIASVLEPTSAA